MADARDPVRWLDDQQTSPAVRAALQTYASHGPDPELRERMRTQLSARGCQPDLNVSHAARGLRLIKSLAAGALAIAVLSIVGARLSGHESPHSAPASQLRVPPENVPAAERENQSAENEPTAPDDNHALEDRTPDVRAVARSVSARRNRKVAPVEQPPGAAVFAPAHPLQPEAELALLTRARRALVGAPARALALTLEHARDHEGGALAQERDLIAIEALLRLRNHAEAGARAERFRHDYPGSAHLERLSVLLAAK